MGDEQGESLLGRNASSGERLLLLVLVLFATRIGEWRRVQGFLGRHYERRGDVVLVCVFVTVVIVTMAVAALEVV